MFDYKSQYEKGDLFMNKRHRSSTMWKSLLSVTITLILAAVTHAHQFGNRAFAAFLVLILIMYGLVFVFQRTRNKWLLGLYELLNGFIIIGFGLFNGFWNHAVKVLLTYLHNGELPVVLQRLFISPNVGSATYEIIGILTCVASLFVGFHGMAVINEFFKPDQKEGV